MKVISFKRQDHCIECHSDRSIEIYDEYDKPINYSYYLDTIDKRKSDTFDRRPLCYMKCRKCWVEYQITWENKIPEPMINKITMERFMDKVFVKESK